MLLKINPLELRVKLFFKANFFNVDAKRLVADYHRDAEETERKKCLTQAYCAKNTSDRRGEIIFYAFLSVQNH
ncbi:hypothetical protein [Nostoc sp.]|uniref:hypothetical protein n=1 Tax=Nostoc sp. TaxID=1180 RepID=UPI002FF5CE34